MFNANGLNVYTNTTLDFNDFNRDKCYRGTGLPLNHRGFDINGINSKTQTRYDVEGNNIYGYSKFDETRPFEVSFTAKYFENILRDSVSSFYPELGKEYKILVNEQNKALLERKFNEVILRGIFMEPELKKILLKTINKLKFIITGKIRELKKLKVDIVANKVKITELESSIKYFGELIARFEKMR